MKQKYELPKDFRFVSSVDDFEECANITRQLIEKKKCAILLGTFKEVEIKLGIKRMNLENYIILLRGMIFAKFYLLK